jgi:hypothetical protein
MLEGARELLNVNRLMLRELGNRPVPVGSAPGLKYQNPEPDNIVI